MFPKERTASNFFISIKYFLNRKSKVEFDSRQAVFVRELRRDGSLGGMFVSWGEFS